MTADQEKLMDAISAMLSATGLLYYCSAGPDTGEGWMTVSNFPRKKTAIALRKLADEFEENEVVDGR